MTKSRTQTNSSGSQNSRYQNQFDWTAPPISREMQAVIDMSNRPIGTNPSTFHRFNDAKNELDRSYADPFGAATSPDVREKALRSQKFRLDVTRDKALREDMHEQTQMQFGQRLAAAGLTAPQLINTGGTSSGTQTGQQTTTQQQPLINTIATIGGAAAGF